MIRLVFLLLFLVSFTTTAVSQLPPTIPNEIAVSATANAWLSPDTVRVTLLIEATGKDSTEAQTLLENKRNAVVKTLGALGDKSLVIADRGYKLSGAASDQTPISPTTTVRMKSYLGVESSDNTKTSTIVDAAIRAGATSVSEITYRIVNEDKQKAQAIAQATERAREKAGAIASSLNVSVGPLLSASVIDDPEGKIIRMKQQVGDNLVDYSDQDSQVIVNLRFEAIKKPS